MREEQNQREQSQIDALTGIPTVRLAIGFCLMGLVGALFLTPLMDQTAEMLAGAGSATLPSNIDRTITGAIATQPRQDRPRRYIIRRSVMQKNPTAPCFLYEDGSREGDC